jgi:hypothetical protein
VGGFAAGFCGGANWAKATLVAPSAQTRIPIFNAFKLDSPKVLVVARIGVAPEYRGKRYSV